MAHAQRRATPEDHAVMVFMERMEQVTHTVECANIVNVDETD
jgi:hypothetical protein